MIWSVKDQYLWEGMESLKKSELNVLYIPQVIGNVQNTPLLTSNPYGSICHTSHKNHMVKSARKDVQSLDL